MAAEQSIYYLVATFIRFNTERYFLWLTRVFWDTGILGLARQQKLEETNK